MKSVYCAVRTGYLNKAVCASYLKGKPIGALKHAINQLCTTVKMKLDRTLSSVHSSQFHPISIASFAFTLFVNASLINFVLCIAILTALGNLT
jgi:hypothetical protein